MEKTVTEEGGKYEFGWDQSPPTGPSAKSDLNYGAVGTKQTPVAAGHDTYQGIPGDGKIGGVHGPQGRFGVSERGPEGNLTPNY